MKNISKLLKSNSRLTAVEKVRHIRLDQNSQTPKSNLLEK